MADLPKALDYFSKGVHVGKLLVAMGETPVLPPATLLLPPVPGRQRALAGPR